ncbi:Uncharacterised protein [Mycoplasmoides gallisepticum]|uniref:Uncharacterized protein n=1 Tax=Mycoplasmoides gallisepticum TaxID=2096 RepID=A0A3B0Q2W9_MYCGL|nr:Uncharacterised protein [Mycoplasmoides gallisepticum]
MLKIVDPINCPVKIPLLALKITFQFFPPSSDLISVKTLPSDLLASHHKLPLLSSLIDDSEAPGGRSLNG